MSYLQRLANLIAAPASPGGAPSASGAYSVGYFLARRAAPSVYVRSPLGFAAEGSMESNSFGPEAGPDSALVAQNPVDVDRGNVIARQTASEPRQVAGNSESRSKSSKQRVENLEVVRRSIDVRIQSGDSTQRSERQVSETGAKDSSELGAVKTVHANSPSLRPAQPFSSAPSSPAVQRDAAPISTFIRSSAPSGPVAETPAAAGPQFEGLDHPASRGTTPDLPSSGAISNNQLGASTPSHDARAPFVYPSKSNDASVPPIVTIESVSASGPQVSIESAPGSQTENPSATVKTVFHVSAAAPEVAPSIEAPRSAESRASVFTPESGPSRDAPSPTVHIGSIEIIVEAPAEPRAAAPAPSPLADFSSRHYLRGL